MGVSRTHRPVWSGEKCLPCGACTQRCPVVLFPELLGEEDSLRARVARSYAFPSGDATPEIPPCRAACPLGQDVPRYASAMAAGRADEALSVILETNPFPSVCGRVCPGPCMKACVRGCLDEPVDIRTLKRAAVERAVRAGSESATPAGDAEVAVIGAGPAGLAAAFELRRRGRSVSVYEAEAEPGGLLRYGVAGFDVPRDVLAAEIGAILAAGVELRTGVRLGADISLADLSRAGAVLIATGCPKGRGLAVDLPGDKAPEGLFDAPTLARMVAREEISSMSGPAAVVGGGAMAVAVARTLRRLGSGPVTLVASRGMEELPADEESLRRAEEEGVRFMPEMRPVEVLGEGRVQGIRCAPVTLSEEDGAGRRWPTGLGEETVDLEVTTIVAAEDRDPDLGWLGADDEIRRGPLGTILVDGASRMTSRDGVFADGDVATGPMSVVSAIATGMKAAVSIDRYLGKGTK